MTSSSSLHQDRAASLGALKDGLAGLREEAAALAAFLAWREDIDPGAATRTDGASVPDILAHLILFERLACLAIVDRGAFEREQAAVSVALALPAADEPADDPAHFRLRAFERAMLGGLPTADLVARWNKGLDAFAAAAEGMEEDRHIDWFGATMRVSRLLAARQTDIWLQGQDLYDALQVRRINTDRLSRVADFGVRTRGLAFAANGLAIPPAPYVRLLAPSGRVWTWGDPDAAERIDGSAEHFCLVVTQRRNVRDVAIEVTGAGAARWMEIAQVAGGVATRPPEPGTRAWELCGGPHSPALPHAPTIPAMVHYLGSRFGELPQVMGAGGETSFAEIERRSRRIAAGLLARGAAKGARIGVLMPNGADWVSAALAIQRIGGVAVLLSTFAKGRELAHLIRHSDIHSLLMVDRDLGHSLAERVAGALPELARADGAAALMLAEAPFLRAIYLWGDVVPAWARPVDELEAAGDALPPGLLEAAEGQVVAADPALIIYTSGSQAEPKAAIHSHGAVVRQSHHMSAYSTYQPGDRLMTTMPLFWVGGLITSLLAASYGGAALVCPDSPDPGGMAAAVAQFGVTHVALWPAQLGALLAQDSDGDMLARLRPNLAQQLGMFGQTTAERTPSALGMTETLGPHSMEYYGAALPVDRAGSFGRQVGTNERAVIDPETGVFLRAGETGEIVLRGGHMMLGMHRKERGEVFTPDGWYRTGDLGCIDAEGHLYFHGRSGDLVKSAGANISPREVELALAALPEVQEAVVLGLPDSALGELLVAVIVLRPGATIDAAAVQARLRADLSSYKVPKRIVFMAHEDLPRTPSAKVIKHQLRDRLIGG